MVYEEDIDFSDNYNFQTSSASAMDFEDTPFVIQSECSNINIETLDPFGDDTLPELITIKVYNQNKKSFGSGLCLTFSQFERFRNDPDNWNSVYSKPKGSTTDSTGGETTVPLNKLVLKLPINNIYISAKSCRKIQDFDKANNFPIVLYALPLFEGRRRRIGNVVGMIGASMNHGQVPGSIIYKIFTKSEMKLLKSVETDTDEFNIDSDDLKKLKESVSANINKFNVDFSTRNKMRGEHNNKKAVMSYEDPEDSQEQDIDRNVFTQGVSNEDFIETFVRKMSPLIDSIIDIRELHDELQWFVQDLLEGNNYEDALESAKYLLNSVIDHLQQVKKEYTFALQAIKLNITELITKFS